jgi:hypothetical protein
MKGVKILFGAIAILYLLGTSYQMYLFLNFQSHKEEIIEEYCVNKDKPEMHCDGNCHLKKKITESPIQAMTSERSSEKSPHVTLISFDTFNEAVYSQINLISPVNQQCCTYHKKTYSYLRVDKVAQPPEEV